MFRVARDFTRFLDTFSLANRLFVPLVQSEYKIVDDFSGYKSGADGIGYSDHKLRACYKVRVQVCVAYCARPPGLDPNRLRIRVMLPRTVAMHKVLVHGYRLAN